MGTWGFGAFENDDACDWVAELADATDFGVVEAALDAVNKFRGDYLDAPDCTIAIAAAEVVAASRNRAGADVPAEVAAWTTDHGAAPPALAERARRALATIRAKSELRDLFEESNCFDDWSRAVSNLLDRLGT